MPRASYGQTTRLKRQEGHKKQPSILRRLLKCSAGSTALMFALAAPAVIAMLGVATDFAMVSAKRAKLQDAADQAAIAGVKEFSLASSDQKSVSSTAESFARGILNDPGLSVSVAVSIDAKANKVQVDLTEVWTPFFAQFFSSGITPVRVSATAGLFGESKVCVLALAAGASVVKMKSDSHLQATGCTVYVNSKDASSVFLGDTSTIDAQSICTAGGVKNNGSVSAAKIVTDCPVVPDPLAGRQPPKIAGCAFNNTVVNSGTASLMPGVYCGGLKVDDKAIVNFSKGEYVIKDGLFQVSGTAQVHGKDVGFYLTGEKTMLHFLGNATIDLSGRESGGMAGMLFFEDPTVSVGRNHKISASNAHTLTGTIYLPRGNLMVDPMAKVGSKSAYTAIVAGQLIVQNGPTLVLNSDYEATPVPVPEGIRTAADVHLVN